MTLRPFNRPALARLRMVTVLAGAAVGQQGDGGFSVRLDHAPGSAGGSVHASSHAVHATSHALSRAIVQLHPPCSSFECGIRLLEGRFATRSRWQALFSGTGRFSGPFGASAVTSATESRDWWVVIDGGGLPVARLWRPGTGGDDLPPAPRIAGRACVVAVTAEDDGSALEAAAVAPFSAAPAADTAFAGVPGWRPWLQTAVTSPAGRAVVRVPSHMDTTILVHAVGHVSQSATCPAIGAGRAPSPVVAVHLPRVHDWREFVLHSARRGPLSGALVRDRLGWPLALSDESGRVLLPADPQHWWVEEGNGRIHAAFARTDAGSHTLNLTTVTADRRGRVDPGASTFAPNLELLPSRSPTRYGRPSSGGASTFTPNHKLLQPQVAWWLDPAGRPWSGLEPAMAFVQQAPLSDGRFETSMLEGDRIWFSRPGFSHDTCLPGQIDEGDCPAPRPAALIRGTVLDSTGNRLRDVEITFSSRVRRANATAVRHFLRTREDGRFEMDRIAPATGLFDLVEVAIDHPGFLPLRSPGVERYREADGEYVIELERGVLVTGRVFDAASGAAISDGEVGLGPFSRNGSVGVLNELSELRVSGVLTTGTDAAGHFIIRSPPGRFDLAVRTDSHAFRLIRGVQVEGDDLDLGAIFLDHGTEFVGLVVDGNSKPVPGADVSASVTRTPNAFGQATAGDVGDAFRLQTDADGLFRLPGLTAWMKLDLVVAAPDFAIRRLGGVAVESAEPSEPFEIRLAPGAVIAGKVTSKGKPVAGTFELSGSSQRHAVDLLSNDSSFAAAGRIADTGEFRIRSLVADRYRLLVQAADGRERRVAVELDEGEERWLDIDLDDATGRIVGRVTDRRRGLAGIEVRLGDIDRTISDSTGRFAFHQTPTGSFILEASPDGGATAQQQYVRVHGGKQRADFDFGFYRVSGRVVMEDGGALSAAATLKFLPPWALQAGRFAREPSAAVTLGSEGSFDVQLRKGSFDVTLDLDGRVLQAREKFEVRGDRADAVVRVSGAPTGRIEGRVYGLSESERHSLQVEAVDGRLNRLEASVDADGAFAFPPVAAGRWTVVGTVGASNRRATAPVQVGDDDVYVELQFERGHDITGAVLFDGAPWPGAQVLLMRDDERESARREFTRYDGSFVFRDLRDGVHTVAVGATIRSVQAPGQEHLEIRLSSGQLRGRVLDPESAQPAKGVEVIAWPAAARRNEAEALGLTWTSWTDELGHFDFGRLPSGRWSLELSGQPGTRRRLHLPPQGEIDVSIQTRADAGTP